MMVSVPEVDKDLDFLSGGRPGVFGMMSLRMAEEGEDSSEATNRSAHVSH